MTAQILASELASLIQDSKRKNPELKAAAERSSQDLKSLPVTSETQLAADLLRRPHFITPFLLACHSKNTKSASSGVGCLQRLAAASALSKERLKEVVEALKDSTSGNLEAQLKVLQTLPALSQNYSGEVRGDLLFGLLQICSALQASKQYAVSNSSIATLQQLILTLFENLEHEDRRPLEIPVVTSLDCDGEKIQLRPVAHDAYRTFHDLCLLTEGSKAAHIKVTSLSQTAGLELLESILSNHASAFETHPEQGHTLRTILLPFIIRALSDKQNFPVTVRVMRVLLVIIRRHLSIASAECEVALSLLNHMLDQDAAPSWKRALSLEIFRQVYSDTGLVLKICALYDDFEGKKAILRDNLALFVRLASEKPALIGLGQQSGVTVGRSSLEEVSGVASMMDSTGVAGLIEAAGRDNTTGLSILWSSVRVSCIDQLDKTEAPSLPETYVYSLVLTCINNLAENLARFILPLTVHKEPRGRKRAETQNSTDREADGFDAMDEAARTISHRKHTVPINPLTLESHKNAQNIKRVASIIDHSWPAIMACCSTFLYATLDNDYYRALVRSFQKFTQVAGLLRMTTPRDAFLTTLGKAAVPSHIIATSMSPSTPNSEHTSMYQTARGLLNVDAIVSPGASENNRRHPSEPAAPILSARNLLCLRALLNVAIALGPTLHEAWSILCETLQQTEIIMSTSTVKTTSRHADPTGPQVEQNDESSLGSIAVELKAVQGAATRMFESTVDYPDEAFVHFLSALCHMLNEDERGTKSVRRRDSSASPRPEARRIGSLSIAPNSAEHQVQKHLLTLQKIAEVCSLNMDRFTQDDDLSSGWILLSGQLTTFACDSDVEPKPRRLAAEVLSTIARSSLAPARSQVLVRQNSMQRRSLLMLKAVVDELSKHTTSRTVLQARDNDFNVQLICIDALRSILEQNGDVITDGWDIVFDIILSAFQTHELSGPNLTGPSDARSLNTRLHFHSVKLGQAAFDTIQLVCSDFISSIPPQQFQILVDLPFRFCIQQDDLNVALTMTTIYSQLADSFKQNFTNNDLINSLDMSSSAFKEQDTGPRSAYAWAYVLLRLNTISTDARSEVRNTAVHTMLRICADCNFGAAAWSACLRKLLLPAITMNVRRLKSGSNFDERNSFLSAWHEITELLVTGITRLLAGRIQLLITESHWNSLWLTVVQGLEGYLQLQAGPYHTIVFTSLSLVLESSLQSRLPSDENVEAAFQVWLRYPPAAAAQLDSNDALAEPYEAYAQCFEGLYSQSYTKPGVDFLRQAMENLLHSMEAASSVKYGTDIDTMTPLQTRTLMCLQKIYKECPEARALLIENLAQSSLLPFSTKATPEKTFVAFAKVAMDQLGAVLGTTRFKKDNALGAAIAVALKCLSEPIRRKYTWKRQGKDPSLWETASTTSLIAINAVLPHIAETSASGSTLQDLWLAVIQLSHHIASTDCSPISDINVILVDEEKDIGSLRTLRNILVPALGSPSISDSTRRLYAANLFRASLLHNNEALEVGSLSEEPLSGLYEVKFGTTARATANVRSQMAYFCLSELISLTAVSRNNAAAPEDEQCRVQLARAAAPYLILRAALPIKTYIADQPLRGGMPQPSTERRELLFVLRQMRGLDSEPRAIPGVDGAATEHKRHLVRLFALVNRAVKVAGSRKGLARDEEVMEELLGWQADVGAQFGQ